MTPSPREVFLRLVQGVCSGEGDLHRLYAEQTDVRHPMNDAAPLTSRDALRAHFTPAPGAVLPVRRAVDITVHQTADPEVIVAEFTYEFAHADDTTTRVPCVFVMRVRNGEIVESRDYIDPVRRALAREKDEAKPAGPRR